MSEYIGIGGHDIATLCGVNPYGRTLLQIWRAKRKLTNPDFFVESQAMFWGKKLEPIILEKYIEETGRMVSIPNEMFVHPKYPFMIGYLDGVAEDRVVEIKTTKLSMQWGKPGTDEVPINCKLQVQFYMMLTGFTVADIPVLIGGHDFRIYKVFADTELHDIITKKCIAFWNLVESGVPPKQEEYEEDCQCLYRSSKRGKVVATKEVEKWVEIQKEINNNMEILEKFDKKNKEKIQDFMGSADVLFGLNGQILATWKDVSSKKKLDVNSLFIGYPEICERYLIETESSRRFIIT